MNDSVVVVSQQFLELNDTCESGHMPRLSQYCLETRLDLFYDDIYFPASDYYADTVLNQNIPLWLNSSSIPTDQAADIKTMLMESCIN